MQLKREMVYEELRRKIVSGVLRPGDKLPGGLELARKFNVGHLTMRSAMRQLADDHLVEFVNGRGTFVTESTPALRKFLVVAPLNAPVANAGAYEITPAFVRRCTESGVGITLIGMEMLRSSDETAVRQLRERRFDAVLLNAANYRGDEPELALLRALEVPTLIPHAAPRDLTVTGFSVLRNDEPAAWRSGVEFLRAKGFRRIALLLPESGSLRGRNDAEHLKLLRELGAQADAGLLVKVPLGSDNDLPPPVDAVRKLLAGAAPEAIFCFSDFFAVRLYEALAELGVRVPEDIAVLGYCGFAGGEFLTPPLSTVDCDYSGAGQLAAELLIGNRISIDTPQTFIVPHHVIERRSTASR